MNYVGHGRAASDTLPINAPPGAFNPVSGEHFIWAAGPKLAKRQLAFDSIDGEIFEPTGEDLIHMDGLSPRLTGRGEITVCKNNGDVFYIGDGRFPPGSPKTVRVVKLNPAGVEQSYVTLTGVTEYWTLSAGLFNGAGTPLLVSPMQASSDFIGLISSGGGIAETPILEPRPFLGVAGERVHLLHIGMEAGVNTWRAFTTASGTTFRTFEVYHGPSGFSYGTPTSQTFEEAFGVSGSLVFPEQLVIRKDSAQGLYAIEGLIQTGPDAIAFVAMFDLVSGTKLWDAQGVLVVPDLLFGLGVPENDEDFGNYLITRQTTELFSVSDGSLLPAPPGAERLTDSHYQFKDCMLSSSVLALQVPDWGILRDLLPPTSFSGVFVEGQEYPISFKPDIGFAYTNMEDMSQVSWKYNQSSATGSPTLAPPADTYTTLPTTGPVPTSLEVVSTGASRLSLNNLRIQTSVGGLGTFSDTIFGTISLVLKPAVDPCLSSLEGLPTTTLTIPLNGVAYGLDTLGALIQNVGDASFPEFVQTLEDAGILPIVIFKPGADVFDDGSGTIEVEGYTTDTLLAAYTCNPLGPDPIGPQPPPPFESRIEGSKALQLWGGPVTDVVNANLSIIQDLITKLADNTPEVEADPRVVQPLRLTINLNGYKLLNLKPYDPTNTEEIVTHVTPV